MTKISHQRRRVSTKAPRRSDFKREPTRPAMTGIGNCHMWFHAVEREPLPPVSQLG
jgi:hypothetical protein